MYHYLGCLLHKAGRLREAEARLIEKSSDMVLAYLERGEVRLQLGERSSALGDLRHFYESQGTENVESMVQKHVSGSPD